MKKMKKILRSDFITGNGSWDEYHSICNGSWNSYSGSYR